MARTGSQVQSERPGHDAIQTPGSPHALAHEMSLFSSFREHDAVGLARLVQAGDASATELVEAAIDAIDAIDPRINAVVDRLYDDALGRARRVKPTGPLAGVPILLKDMIERNGTRLSYASAFFKEYSADHSHPVVDRLETAGMIVVGRTNASEFGLLPSTEPVLHGPTHNPWDLARSPGGSSGGSAAAVSVGMVPIAHGNDGGGSLRIPASACGVFGLKPTRGRTPQAPDIDPNGIVYEHVLTRTVRDSAAVLDATVGNVPADRWRLDPPPRPFLDEVSIDPGRLHIGFSLGGHLGLDCDPAIDEAVRMTASWCESLGHEVEEFAFTYDGQRFVDAFLLLWAITPTGIVKLITSILGSRPSSTDFERFTWDLVELGERHDLGDAWLLWRGAIQETTAALTALLTQFDVLITPVTAQMTPLIGHLDPELGLETLLPRITPYAMFTAPMNAAGVPAMSVPLHQTEAGLPIGVHVVGRWGDEATLFRLASQFEQTHSWVTRRPPMP